MIVNSTEYLTVLEANGISVPAAGLSLLTLCAPFIQQRIEKVLGFKIESGTYTEYLPSKLTNYAAGGDFLVGNWDVISGRAVGQMRDQQHRRMLHLTNLPVRTITEIREYAGAWDTAGGSWPDTSVLPATSYHLDIDEAGICWSGRVIRNHGVWLRDLRTIKVTYTAGLTQNEINANYLDLKLALLTAIQVFYIGTIMRSNAGAAGGFVVSTGITDFNKTFGTPEQLGIYFQNDYTLPAEASRMISPYVNLSRYIG